MWPLKAYASYFKDNSKEKPKCASYSKVNEALKDELMQCKLEFFVSVATTLQEFLKFQTNFPMAPFLSDSLTEMLSKLFDRFIKQDILSKAIAERSLTGLDVRAVSNQVKVMDVDIGFRAKQTLRAVEQKKLATEKDIYAFKHQCLKFLQNITEKLVEKSPLHVPLVKYLSSLGPRCLVKVDSSATDNFEKILQVLLDSQWRQGDDCDVVLSQYRLFVEDMKEQHLLECQQFSPTSTRLDPFLKSILKDDPKYAQLWQVIKLLLTLSHGQAAVERGFSVNKAILDQNMKEKSFVSLRRVHDAVPHMEGYKKLMLTPRLKWHLKCARSRYVSFLEDQKKNKKDEQKENEKKRLLQQIFDGESKKCRLEE